MIRKKEGSALVTTIIIFAALLTVGMALLSMSLGDYKMRQSQNKKIRNLYGAESGLDVAYDIIVRDFDSAAQFGAFKAKQLEVKDANTASPYKTLYEDLQKDLEDLNEDADMSLKDKADERKRINNEIDILINKEFRRSFKAFLYDSTIIESEDRDERDEGNHYDYSTPNMFKYSLEGKKSNGTTRNYIIGLKADGGDDGTKERELTDDIAEYDDFKWSDIDLVSNEGASEPIIEVDIPTFPEIETSDSEYESNKEIYNKDYEIRVNSTFITKEGNTEINGKNKRTVQAVYNLKVPNYKDVVFGETEVEKHSIYNDKGLTIGGNMTVGKATEGKFDLIINGNIFVEGKSEGISLGNKYKGGISLNNVDKVNFNGNVVTGKTFNVGKDVEDATISEDLYASNVYAGMTDDSVGNECTLTVSKDMILNNDLTLKSTHTNITTTNFYGINSDTIESSNGNKGIKIMNSSSIIVNKYKDGELDTNPSNIRIKEHALIMGVAYINTENGYATGESIGVKGNYNAYSEHVPSDEDGAQNSLEFDTDDDHEEQSPLYLVNGTVIQKDEHFFNYWNGKSGAVDAGGVHFDEPTNVSSVGSIVYQENGSKIRKANGTIESLNTESLDKKKKYASRVYDMNMEEISSTSNTKLENLYNGLSERKTVDGLMSFPNTNENDKFIDRKPVDIGDKNSDYGIFNPNAENDIEIIEGASGGQIEVSGLDGGTITISVPRGKTLKAFIATAGNVTIQGEVDIKGNIIAKKNLDIKSSGKKTITYDIVLAERLRAIDEGAELFEQVFGAGDVELKDEANKTEIVVQYDLSKFLKNLLWKLVK